MDYATDRGTTLPWGHWLRIEGSAPGILIDERGSRWKSVRNCFWISCLGMPPVDEGIRDELLELVQSVLLAADRRTLSEVSTRIDMFDRSTLFARFFLPWLASTGLTSERMNAYPTRPGVSDEGRAALRMLDATRAPRLAGTPVGSGAAFSIIRDLGRIVGPAPSRIAAVESLARAKPQAFLRETLAGSAGIVLVIRDGGPPMHFQRTVWSQCYPDEVTRDAFYLWLCDRVDRWDAWALMAWQLGGVALTQHLLAMLAAEMPTEV